MMIGFNFLLGSLYINNMCSAAELDNEGILAALDYSIDGSSFDPLNSCVSF